MKGLDAEVIQKEVRAEHQVFLRLQLANKVRQKLNKPEGTLAECLNNKVV